MAMFSKTLLPPILEYAYPAFLYESPMGNPLTYTFVGKLSTVNTIDQVDHVQISIVSNNTNRNGLNPEIFKDKLYFIPVVGGAAGTNQILLELDNIIDGKNIFQIGEETIYPSYYKMQIRLGGPEAHYDPSWGQDVPDDWLKNNTEYFSEWSNAARLKTVKSPEIGIFTLDANQVNELEDTNFRWTGYYNTDDSDESLSYYSFELYDSLDNLIETSGNIYIKEYETPSLYHTFSEVFSNNTDYKLVLNIMTATAYSASVVYNIHTKFSYVKLFNVFDVIEDDDGAFNTAQLKARQVHLVATKPELEFIDSNWFTDKSMEQFEEFGISHFWISEGRLTNEDTFSVPYDDFSVLLSTTAFRRKLMTRRKDCFIDENYLFYIGRKTGNFGSEYYIAYLQEYGRYYFVLKEVIKSGNGGGEVVQYYDFQIEDEVGSNKEYIFIFKKHFGETIFQAKQWLDNEFI